MYKLLIHNEHMYTLVQVDDLSIMPAKMDYKEIQLLKTIFENSLKNYNWHGF